MKSAVKKEKGKVDLFGERYRARAHQLSPRLRAVVSYINDTREVVLEHTAMEIATATQTSDATVVRAIQALGSIAESARATADRWISSVLPGGYAIRLGLPVEVEANRDAFEAGAAPSVVLQATHERALDVVTLEALRARAYAH